jgi:ABC-type polysaccharide transport system permease subunit
MAGLQTIPKETYEAATIDGCGAIKRFTKIEHFSSIAIAAVLHKFEGISRAVHRLITAVRHVVGMGVGDENVVDIRRAKIKPNIVIG